MGDPIAVVHRSARRAAAWMLVAAACGSKAAPTGAPSTVDAARGVDAAAVATADAAAVAPPPAPIDAGASADAGPTDTPDPITDSKKLPEGLVFDGAFEVGHVWKDRKGEHLLLFASSKKERRIEAADELEITLGLAAYHFALVPGAVPRLVRRVRDKAPPCIYQATAAFRDRVELTDGDGDGVKEVSYGYELGCRSDVRPNTLKVFLDEEGKLVIVRGDTRIAAAGEPSVGGEISEEEAGGAPAAFVAQARAYWSRVVWDSYLAPEENLVGAAASGEVDRVEAALESTEAVDEMDEREGMTEGMTPLLAGAGHVEIVKLLLARGADPKKRGRDGDMPLHVAARAGAVEAVQALLDKGAPIDERGDGKKTALHLAASDERLIDVLVGRGAAVSLADEDGATPLHLAVEQGKIAAIRRLLEAKADLTARDKARRTPYDLAMAGGSEELLALLRGHGAGGPGADLAAAAKRGDLELARKALAAGADVKAAAGGDPPLVILLREREGPLLDLLLEKGADVNAPGAGGSTPVHAAIGRCAIDTATRLVAAGAKIDPRDDEGRTPLADAARHCPSIVARLLLERGADLATRDAAGRTPLHAACEGRNGGIYDPDMVPLLLAKGADVRARDGKGRTPLHAAAGLFADAEATVKALLDREAEVAAADAAGWTPLHVAARNDRHGVARLLLGRGAPRDVVSGTMVENFAAGMTPLAVARQAGARQVLEVLDPPDAGAR